MSKFLRAGAAAALLAALATPAVADIAPETAGGGGGPAGRAVTPAPRSISAIVASDPRFSTLNRALKACGLDRSLAAPGTITLFAPTNEAFAVLPPGQLALLLKPASKARLAALLQGHLLEGRLPASAMADRRIERTLSGTYVAFTQPPAGGGGGMGTSRATVSGAELLQTDLAATNGVVHAIDRVILP